MIYAADVKTIGQFVEWLAERGLKMKPRLGRGSGEVHVVELRKAGQPHVARPLVTGTANDWHLAVLNAMCKYEEKESQSS